MPKSSTTVYLTNFVSPVSSSTSTSQICEPEGNEKLEGSKKEVSIKPGSTPSGRGELTSPNVPGR